VGGKNSMQAGDRKQGIIKCWPKKKKREFLESLLVHIYARGDFLLNEM